MSFTGPFASSMRGGRAVYGCVPACVLAICLAMGGCSRKDGKQRPNAPFTDLTAINATIKSEDYRLAREDFSNPDRFRILLQGLVGIYYRAGGHLVGSSSAIRIIETNVSDWLHGTEKDEKVLRDLCRDPVFEFDGDLWTVRFNVLKPSGGVDAWEVMGEHDPHANINCIKKIKARPLKRPGTFTCPLVG